jgi:hypothetical protein
MKARAPFGLPGPAPRNSCEARAIPGRNGMKPNRKSWTRFPSVRRMRRLPGTSRQVHLSIKRSHERFLTLESAVDRCDYKAENTGLVLCVLFGLQRRFQCVATHVGGSIPETLEASSKDFLRSFEGTSSSVESGQRKGPHPLHPSSPAPLPPIPLRYRSRPQFRRFQQTRGSGGGNGRR